MRNLPIFLDVDGRPALVLGSGEVAERKADALRRAGAIVRIEPRFEPAMLQGCAVAIGADADDADLAALSAAAQAVGIPVNVVDKPALCSFITPSVIDRDPLLIAVSTGGAAPVLARLVRARIEALIPPAWGRLAALADSLKAEIRAALPDVVQRRRVLERSLDGRVAALVFAGQEDAAREAFRQEITERAPVLGMVHFVDAGPGPADLLTLRTHRLLGEADLVLHDTDVPAAVLDMARRDAERLAADMPDPAATLIHEAERGRMVVRLRSATPSAARQAATEAARLTAADLQFEMVRSEPAAFEKAGHAGG